MELLIAIGLPIAYLVVTMAVLVRKHQALPAVVQRLTARNALLWNTVVGLSIGLAALRWALQR
jgi:hypothetical protein